MSITLLLITTVLCVGFLFLIGAEHTIPLPLLICMGLITYTIRLLYRKTPTRQNTIIPRTQEYLLSCAITATCAWGLSHRGGQNRHTISVVIIIIYGLISIMGAHRSRTDIYTLGGMGYITACLSAIATNAISYHTLSAILIITGIIVNIYNTINPDTLIQKNLPHITHVTIITTIYRILPGERSTLCAIIIMGAVLSLQQQEHNTKTTTQETITAEMILDGKTIYNQTPVTSNTPSRPTHLNNIIGNNSHSTTTIRIIIGIISYAISTTIIYQYTNSIIESIYTIVFGITSVLFGALVRTHHHQHTPKQQTLWVVTSIIITHILVLLNSINLLRPNHTHITIAIIIRNIASITMLLYSTYQKNTNNQTHYYRMIANHIIITINSLLVATYIQQYGRRTIIIILALYWSTYGIITHHIHKNIKQ